MIKKIIIILLKAIKVLIIGFILYDFNSSLHNGAPLSLHFEVFRAELLLYYLPFSVFSLFILWFMKNRKLFIQILVFDFIIVTFLDKIISVFM